MRTTVILAAALGLSACGGGGGGTASAPPPGPTTAPTIAPGGNNVTPQFRIVVPAKTTASIRGRRAPQFVSSATQSITITLTSVGGNPPTVAPTSVTTNISGASCSSGCTVNGPPSPPGQADAYSLVTYDAANGAGNALDRGSVTFTPIAGQPNSVTVTLDGVPFTIAITGVPTTFAANSTPGPAALTVTVADHSGQTITGTYATPVQITNPDASGAQGVVLSSTIVNACTGSVCKLTTNTDPLSLTYGGLAENPVVLTSSNADVTSSGGVAGTATFTPLLNAITSDGTNTNTLLGGVGIDLYTNNNTSPVGYSGTLKYQELGFTNAPYDKQLSLVNAPSCAAFATLATGANTANETPFTATAIASPVAGHCMLTVTDGLTDQTNPLPTFQVTYTTTSVTGNAIHRR